MSSESVISVEALSKSYQIYEQPRDRLIQMVLPRAQRALGLAPRRYYQDFWALRDVSLHVSRGETVGIIGRNGSGKSTLLQIVAGTLSPTTGDVKVAGRVAALLELGSGFTPEFTGRENVYTNAAVLGLSREEIDSRFEAITSFADIGPFIDQPTKTYSSGMVLRLAFAVQAQVDPDVLIVDEALAVGDARFQARCFDRLKQLKARGTSVLLVTHSTEQIVTHCDRAVLLDEGRVQTVGPPRDVTNRYLDLLFGRERATTAPSSPTGATRRQSVEDGVTAADLVRTIDLEADTFSTRAAYNPHEYRWGDGGASFLDFMLLANGRIAPAVLTSGDALELYVSLRFERPLACPILGMVIKTKEGVTVFGSNSETLDIRAFGELGQPGETCVVRLAFTCRLAPGDYFVSLGLATRQGGTIVPHDRRYDAIHLQVGPDPTFFGLTDVGLSMSVESRS
jgi:lipopolysaccharide transport system ATP-binding protein